MDDTTLTVLLVVLAVVVVAAVVYAVMKKRQSEKLRDQFGSEYDRTVETTGKRRDAERDLRERTERRERLDIRPLDGARRNLYAGRWARAQEQFVDRPAEAVSDAQRLVTEVMEERGYPVDDEAQQMKDLSVDHADAMGEYRSAHEISQLNDRKQATTEQLRQAMVHYRSLFTRLLDTEDSTDRSGHRDDRNSDADVSPYPDDSRGGRSSERR
ncbi:MAG TPA: hypothetical protein VM433_09130 [Mycobacteriales bacterium]|nr:hypothetical protein [Mycobacteriales bacterium]